MTKPKTVKPGRVMRCRGTVLKREALRYTGRTKSGFERYYARQRCTRKAITGAFCWQHAKFTGESPSYDSEAWQSRKA